MNTTMIVWWVEAISFTHCSNISYEYRSFTHNQHEEYIDCIHIHTLKHWLRIPKTKCLLLDRIHCCAICSFFSLTCCNLRPKPHNIPLLSTCNLQIATKIVYRLCVFFFTSSSFVPICFCLSLKGHLNRIFFSDRLCTVQIFSPKYYTQYHFCLDMKQIFRIGLLEFQRLYSKPKKKDPTRPGGWGSKNIENEIKTRNAHHFFVPDSNLQNNK